MSYPKGSKQAKDYSRAHYIKYKEGYAERNRIRREVRKQWMDEYKAGLSCARCEYKFDKYPETCDFHHVNPEEKSISVANCHTIDRMIEEIKKCIPLCATCHRIEHVEIAKSLQIKYGTNPIGE